MTCFDTASADRTSLYYVAEVDCGVTPVATPPAWQYLRYTGESLEEALSSEESQEIRSDRMLSDIIITDASLSGAVNVEMSFGTYDDFIEAALMGTWGNDATVDLSGVTIDIDSGSSGHLIDSGAGGGFANIKVGRWLKIQGATDPTLDGFYRVVDKAPDNNSVDLYPVPADSEVSTTATISGTMVRNGTIARTFSILKRFEDSDDSTRHTFRGMNVSTWNMSMATASLLTGSFSFTGMNASLDGAAIPNETFGDATTTEVLNCVSSIKNVMQDYSTTNTDASYLSVDFTLDNQHREQKAVGVLGSVGVKAGRLSVTLSGTQYFVNRNQALKFKGNQHFSFSYMIEDTDGNVYIITLPRMKYSSFTFNADQVNSDINASTEATALRDPLTDCMIQVDKFEA